MEGIIEHKFGEGDVFFVYPQGEEGVFLPDMLVRVSEEQIAYLVKGKNVLKTFNFGPNSFTDSISGFVVFINRKNFKKKWGTLEPVPFKDKDLSLIYIKAYGTVDFSIDDGKNFVEKFVMEKKYFITDEMVDFLRNLIFYEFSNALKGLKEVKRESLNTLLTDKLKGALNNFGIKLLDFQIVGGNFIEEKIDGVSEGIEKNQVFCKKCKKEIPLKANFCPFCGEKISNTCPSCKKEVPEFAKFCPFCGFKL